MNDDEKRKFYIERATIEFARLVLIKDQAALYVKGSKSVAMIMPNEIEGAKLETTCLGVLRSVNLNHAECKALVDGINREGLSLEEVLAGQSRVVDCVDDANANLTRAREALQLAHVVIAKSKANDQHQGGGAAAVEGRVNMKKSVVQNAFAVCDEAMEGVLNQTVSETHLYSVFSNEYGALKKLAGHAVSEEPLELTDTYLEEELKHPKSPEMWEALSTIVAKLKANRDASLAGLEGDDVSEEDFESINNAWMGTISGALLGAGNEGKVIEGKEITPEFLIEEMEKYNPQLQLSPGAGAGGPSPR
jgi:hypothetical protein